MIWRRIKVSSDSTIADLHYMLSGIRNRHYSNRHGLLPRNIYINFSFTAYINWTSQTCPNCGAHTGKKTLDIRIHSCFECGYITTRDVAAAQEVKNRGVKAVGQIVSENVCEDGLTGISGHTSLVKNLGSRKSNSQELESPAIATIGG